MVIQMLGLLNCNCAAEESYHGEPWHRTGERGGHRERSPPTTPENMNYDAK